MLSLILPAVTFTETILLPYTTPENIASATESLLVLEEETIAFSWTQIAFGLYVIGLLVFSMRLLFQLLTLYKLKKISQVLVDPPFEHIKTPRPLAPFSFFNSIFYYPHSFSAKELDTIIRHEKVHAVQKHSLDIIAVELLFVIQWFNPFIWLYKNYLKQNLEFIADEGCQSSDRKFYQMLLLKEAVGVTNIPISTSFYNSIIKKRIVMLNQQRSKKINFVKSLIVLPVLALFLMAFNTKTIYQVSEATNQKSNDIELVIKKNTQNQTIEIIKEELLKKEIDFSYTVVRNEADEIIDLELHMKDVSENNTSNYKSTSDGPISPVVIKLNSTTNSFSIGDLDGTVSTNESNTVTTQVTEVKIGMDKDSKTETYTENQKFLKERGVEIDFKGVKRNKKNEIKAIKVFYDNGAGQKGSYVRKSNNPIKPFDISIKFKDKEEAVVSILEKGPWVIESISYSENKPKASSTSTTKIQNAVRVSPNINATGTAGVAETPTNTKILKIRRNNNKKIILLNDKKISLEELEEEGEAVRIFTKSIDRLESFDSITGKTTIEEMKFNNTAGNNVKITRIKTDVENETEYRIIEQKEDNKLYSINNLEEIIAAEGKEELIYTALHEKEKPLVFIDGKKVPYKEMSDLIPDKISSITVLKGKAAMKLHGKEAKHGVILVTTKKK